MTKLIVMAAILASSCVGALAQSGTPQDQRACNASVKRYCSRVVQGGDFAILGCLQQNRSRISAPCQRVLVSYGQ